MARKIAASERCLGMAPPAFAEMPPAAIKRLTRDAPDLSLGAMRVIGQPPAVTAWAGAGSGGWLFQPDIRAASWLPVVRPR